MKFDDYVAYSYDTEDYNYKKNYNNIITITEKDFAIVDQSFYNVFLQYFEAGEYTLSGKYDFGEENIYTALSCPKGIQYLNFKYLDKNGNEYYILDYKTGSVPQNPEFDYQTIVYLLSADKFLKDATSLTFVYIDLKNNINHKIQLSQELKEKYENQIEKTCNTINKTVEFNRVEKNCQYCEYKKFCYSIT